MKKISECDQRENEALLHLALDLRHLFGKVHLCRLRQEVIEGGGSVLLTALFIFHLHHKPNKQTEQN